MTHYQEITCPDCGSAKIGKAGFDAKKTQRYCCKNPDCSKKSFMLVYQYNACKPGIKAQIIDMATNGSGIRDTARVLKINKNTVIGILKKSPQQ
jgi:transposase-like protein